MRKRMGESIEGWRSNHCDLLTDIIQETLNVVGRNLRSTRMQSEIKQPELQLTNHLHA